MPAPTPDPGISPMVAMHPCTARRWIGKNDPSIFGNYGFFPWKGQNIDTPAFVTTKWTTDDDTHPIP